MDLISPSAHCTTCGAARPDGQATGACPACLLRACLLTEDTGSITGSPGGLWVKPIIEGFAIGDEIGRGGMGVVYRATPEDGGGEVAIKVIHDFAGDPLVLESQRIRLTKEAEILHRLDHPAIVGFHRNTETSDGRPSLVLELISGGSVAMLLTREATPPIEDALRIVAQTLEGLAHAHGQGVIHRDIKPGNILLDDAGNAHLTDFGIAQVVDPSWSSFATLTSTNTYLGTAYYVAPEILQAGEDPSTRSDVYSVGILLYQLLTGELPVGHFESATTHMARRGLQADPRLDELIARALARNSADRHADASEMLRELRFLENTAAAGRAQPIPTRRTFMWLDLMWSIGALLLGIVSIDAWLASIPNAPRFPLQLFEMGPKLAIWGAFWTILLHLLLCNWPYRRWRYTSNLKLGRRLPIPFGFQPTTIGPEMIILSLWVIGIVQWIPPILATYHLVRWWDNSGLTAGLIVVSACVGFSFYLAALYWTRVLRLRA